MKENTYSQTISCMLEEHRKSLLELGRMLFLCPEPGFQEVESNKILTSFLFSQQISCKNDICMTGIRATIGEKNGYHIALVADMDALYVRDKEGKTHPFHSCGHSIQTAVMAYVLKLLKECGITEKTGGRVSFIATPAEEFIDFEFRRKLVEEGKIRYYSGKQNMISQGVFDDVDCVISMHINGDTDTLFDIGSTLAGFMVKKIRFLGVASHSGAAPHLGRNALHGANLFLNAIAYLKDQFSKEAGLQIHPVITSCQGSVNVIPDEVVVETYIRANTLGELLEAGNRFDRCAASCAEALGLDCQIEDMPGYMPLKQSEEINQVIYRNMLKICPEECIVKNVISGASGDVGDLGYLLPTVQFGFSGIKGRIHSNEFVISNEENVYLNTARIVMETVCEILETPSLQIKKKDYKERKEFYLTTWLHENKEQIKK